MGRNELLKVKGPVHSEAEFTAPGTYHHGRTPVYRKIGRHIEMRKRGIDISIEHTQGIHAHQAYYAKVAVAAVEVAAALEDIGEPCLVEILLFGGGGEKIHVGFRRGVAIHDVTVSLRVFREHIVVPVGGVTQTHETAHHYRELPVTPVVDLAQAGKKCGEPHSPFRRGIEYLLAIESVGGIFIHHHCGHSVGSLIIFEIKRVSHQHLRIDIYGGVGWLRGDLSHGIY